MYRSFPILLSLIAIISLALYSPLGNRTNFSCVEADEIQTDRLYKFVVKLEGKPPRTLLGRVLVEGEDGGYLVELPNGEQILTNTASKQDVQTTGQAFEPWSKEEVATELLTTLPKSFRSLTTKHYVIIYNTTEAYAKWNASLYERLYRGFYTYWKRLGVDLHESEFPLVAMVFETRDGYLKYASDQNVQGAENMIGFYNMQTNRVASYDLTGIEGMIPEGQKVSSMELVNTLLRQPNAERSVATIVHEAVHQIAFNSGLQKRLSIHNPVAISEGIATFFESPDLKSASGWGGIGNVNQYNLARFRQYLSSRPTNSLLTLLRDDTRFQNSETIGSAYGEAWALSYYLLKARSKEYAAYLQDLSSLPITTDEDSKERIFYFQKHFGKDLEKFDREFLKFLSRQ